MTGDSLLTRLEAEAARAPHQAAIIDAGGRVTTRRQFADRVAAIAAGFRAAGLEPGDRVLFAVRPSAEAIALIAALYDLRSAVVAAQMGVGDSVFASQMRLAAPKWVVAESVLLAAMNSGLVRRIVRLRGGLLPAWPGIAGTRMVRVGRWLPGTNAMSLDEIVKRGAGAAPVPPQTLDDELPGFIVFTSGTTATPKAVVHSRRSMSATLQIVAGQLEIAAGDMLLARELHLILPAIFAGATAVMARHGSFSAPRTLATMRERKITHMFEVTANCLALADHLRRGGERFPNTLRHLLIGGAPVHTSFLQRLADVMPPAATAWCTYGMTEMIPVASIAIREKLSYTGAGDIVGMPVPGASARVSESGELLLRGPNLFTGYLGQPPVDEYATGDLARIDGGRIVLLGRVKDMIIRREHNIYPELHEPVIERIPGVRRCAMVGVYDPERHDERVVLAIEPEDGDGEGEGFDGDAFVRSIERQLRQGPSRIDEAALPDLIMITPLPEGGRSRKVDKEALRTMARARLE